MMNNLTKKQEEVLSFLKERHQKIMSGKLAEPESISPTNIGLALGKEYYSASSYVTSPLKKLVSLGFVKKHEDKSYSFVDTKESEE